MLGIGTIMGRITKRIPKSRALQTGRMILLTCCLGVMLGAQGIRSDWQLGLTSTAVAREDGPTISNDQSSPLCVMSS
jgi:hypothetical protein